MNRRSVLKHIFYGLLALPLGQTIANKTQAAPLRPRSSGRLSVYNTHTRESLAVNYLNQDGSFNTGALEQLNHHFRCHFNSRVHPIDPVLFLLLDAIHTRLAAGNRPFHLVSGYRSPEYNQLLRKKSSGVAAKSLHLSGKAADIRLMGVNLAAIQKTALACKAGGVGTYARFIHVDTGPVRRW